MFPTISLPFRLTSLLLLHNSKMKIAITGARGTVGREVVKFCADAGHHTVQINRSDQECM